MSGSEVIGIVGVAAGALVAITTPLIAGWSDGRRAKHQANTLRLDELRAVLDEAGSALAEAEQVAMRANIRPIGDRDAVLGQQGVDELAALYERTLTAGARIAVRLGQDHPLAATYTIAHSGIGWCLGALGTQVQAVQEAEDPGARELMRMKSDYQWHNGMRRMGRARKEFTFLSAQIIGPDAPVTSRDTTLDTDVPVPIPTQSG